MCTCCSIQTYECIDLLQMTMGSRYVEIFKSNRFEMTQYFNARGGPPRDVGRGGGGQGGAGGSVGPSQGYVQDQIRIHLMRKHSIRLHDNGPAHVNRTHCFLSKLIHTLIYWQTQVGSGRSFSVYVYLHIYLDVYICIYINICIYILLSVYI